MTHSFDALILGGGAAGLMCAIEAGKRGRRVAVLERADRLGKKSSSPVADAATSPIFTPASKTSYPRILTLRSPP